MNDQIEEVLSTEEQFCFLPIQQTSPEYSQFKTYDDLIKIIQTGNLKSAAEYIFLARDNNKDHPEYITWKAKTPHILWGAIPGNDFKKDNIQRLTGKVYIDIDEDAVEKSGYELEDLKAALFKTYPSIIHIAKSFGGNGLGFVINVPSVQDEFQYKQCYQSISSELVKNFNFELKTDSKCTNPNRLNTLTFDENVLFRNDFTDYYFEYSVENTQIEKVNLGKWNAVLDNELCYDSRIFLPLQERFEKYYTSKTWKNITTGLPIQTKSRNIKFNPAEYTMDWWFDEGVISQFESKNSDYSLAYINGIASTVINLFKDRRFKHRSRTKQIISIVSDYLFLRNYDDTITKNYVYNMMLVLNERCITGGDDPKPMPVSGDELNLMTTHVWTKYKANEILPSVHIKKHIRTKNFLDNWYKNPSRTEKELTYDARTVIMLECKRLANVSKKEALTLQFEKQASTINKTMLVKDIINHIAKENKLSSSTVKKEYHKWKGTKEYHHALNTVLIIETMQEHGGTKMSPSKKDVTLFKIQSEYDQLINSGIKPTQNMLAENLNISTKTIKRHWKNVVKSLE